MRWSPNCRAKPGGPDCRKLPKGSQAKAKGMLHEIYLAEKRAEADKAFDLFVKSYEAKYPKATECLVHPSLTRRERIVYNQSGPKAK